MNLESKIIVRNKEMKVGKKFQKDTTEYDKNYRNIPEIKNFKGRKNKKFCKLHKWCFHETDECDTYDKDFYKNKQLNEDKNDNNFLIKEKINNPERTAINGLLFDKKIDHILIVVQPKVL
ncbi:hypothetical protein DMUE_5705 [Dictyocoela muelleri]|nr:hypothetical protein DMUE_5705 [Dictyocoela muelleri]